MKRGFAVIACVCLCLSLIVGFARLSISHPMVDESGCRACHELGEFSLEGLHGIHLDCFACHDGPVQLGTVHSSACLACHPGSMQGTDAERCDLIVVHEGNPHYNPSGASCLSMGCHGDDCSGVPITTTKPATTCPLKEIYGEGSFQVALLRAVRDNFLSQTPEGRELITLYYRWSPVVVRAMEEDEAFKEDLKNMIDRLMPMIEQAVE